MLPLFWPMRNAGVKSGMVPEPPDAISGASCTIRPPRPIAIEQQQGDADHNGAVGQVEGRPVPAGGVEIEKIVDRAMLPAVDRRSVVEGKSVSVRVDLGGRSIITQKRAQNITTNYRRQSQTQ